MCSGVLPSFFSLGLGLAPALSNASVKLYFFSFTAQYNAEVPKDVIKFKEDKVNCCDERQWLSAGYAWHSRPRTTTLSSNLRNGGDESG